MSAILAAILDFSKNVLLCKTAANFTGIGRKHMSSGSKRKIIEIRVKNKNLKQIFPKFYNFLFRTLVCIINYAQIISDDVVQLASEDALIIRLQVLKVSF